jgi:hypothetical protein
LSDKDRRTRSIDHWDDCLVAIVSHFQSPSLQLRRALTVFASAKMRLVRLVSNGRGTRIRYTHYTAPGSTHKTLFRYSLLFKVSLRPIHTHAAPSPFSVCVLVHAHVTKPQIKSHTRASHRHTTAYERGLSNDSSKYSLVDKCGIGLAGKMQEDKSDKVCPMLS